MNADRLDQLLAQGNLSGAQYDDIERRVLERVGARPEWSFRPVASLVALIVAGASLLSPPTSHGDFRAKGGSAPHLAIGVVCADGQQHCRHGDTLMFTVNTALARGYFYAYAEREGPLPGERIWYFPTAAGHAPRVTHGDGTVVLPEGIRLGQEHAPGRYRVTGWIAETPLLRAGIPLGATPFAEASARVAIQIEE